MPFLYASTSNFIANFISRVYACTEWCIGESHRRFRFLLSLSETLCSCGSSVCFEYTFLVKVGLPLVITFSYLDTDLGLEPLLPKFGNASVRDALPPTFLF